MEKQKQKNEMIYLREIKRSDVKALNKWRNDPELISYLGAPFRFINIETDEAWFASYQKSRSSQVRCAIVPKNSGIRQAGWVRKFNRHRPRCKKL
jgi:RimJ/RimL family protein N-acetyltransferase